MQYLHTERFIHLETAALHLQLDREKGIGVPVLHSALCFLLLLLLQPPGAEREGAQSAHQVDQSEGSVALFGRPRGRGKA